MVSIIFDIIVVSGSSLCISIINISHPSCLCLLHLLLHKLRSHQFIIALRTLMILVKLVLLLLLHHIVIVILRLIADLGLEAVCVYFEGIVDFKRAI